MTAREIIAALKGRWHGQYGSARCPAHDDINPSLAIKDAPDGGITVHCFAGCDWRDVKDTLRRDGLLPERGADNGHDRKEKAPPSRAVAVRREAAETEDAEAEDVAAAKKANDARLHCAIGSTLLAAVKERNI